MPVIRRRRSVAIGAEAVPASAWERVLNEIRESEVVELAVHLASIDSPTGEEGPVSDAIYRWLADNGFLPRRVGLFPDRCNVCAVVKGVGGGPSLLFNSHMDTTIAGEETLVTPRAADPIFHSAWRDGDLVYGNGVCNNKGPMATWMIACRALREAGVKLRGDLVMTTVVGEIGVEPVDEFQPPRYVAKEAGARYVVTRGYVANYGVVAEGTDFTLGWVEAGKAFFKVSVLGIEPPLYTPYIKRPLRAAESPSAIVRAARVIEALEAWAYEYETRNVYECAGGTVIPKVNIGAIRSGVPYKITKTTTVCELYLDVRITPVQDVLDVQRSLTAALEGTGIPAEVELYTFRRGYEAQNVDRLAECVRAGHARVFGTRPGRPVPPVTSMWRDCNVFNEVGIPTVIYGPAPSVGGGNLALRVEDLVKGAQAYAAIAMETCGVAR